MSFINNKLKINGVTEQLICPNCKEEVNMKILRSATGIGALNISVYNFKVEYLALCPACGAIFSVNDNNAINHAESKSKDFSEITENKLNFIKCIKL